ncbi:MAG TPA: UDP-N-acetylmuramoyl-L-alanine--D-glutamate ligase, partial [Ramlibacter sp.]|nr:UDP-N-acetylmuramoyl-L-alanine--D-glutamate ligase [Ramlibacter sp.]
MEQMRDQPVLVLGCGASGLAMARWCAGLGAQVTVADTREAPPQLAQLLEQVPQARFIHGEFTGQLLEGQRLVLRSPGLTPAQVAPVAEAARAAGVPVRGELGLFADALAAMRQAEGYHPAVLAVTGTNGKTTVTALTGQLVERSGKTVAVAG